jgi:uncharacterized repeat protein (TIGR02543 family)
MLDQNVTATAHWTRNVTFDLNGGHINDNDTNPMLTIAEGATVGQANMPANPTREGYIFVGWRLNNGHLFNGATVVPGGHFTVTAWFVPPGYCAVIANGQFDGQAGPNGITGAEWELCFDGRLIVDEGFINIDGWTKFSPWHD